MRILINALFLIPNRVGGTETYLRGLVCGLAEIDHDNKYILSLGPEATPTFEPPNARWRIIRSPLASSWRPARLSLEQLWLPRLASAVGADVIHSAGYTGPLLPGTAHVTTIHDMNYKRHPEDLSLAERLVYTALIPPIARSSQRVLSDSAAAREDIVRWTGAAAERVSVVHLGKRVSWPGDPADDAARLARAGVGQPFVLSVAASYPHKNLKRLIEAFPLESASSQPTQLVVLGLRGRAQGAIELAARQRKNAIRILGWVDDALLATLYRRATAFAFPSLYEGFGLPILEAMALGAPVVTSNIGAMAEVAGGAAELVDPYHVASIHRGLQAVVSNARRRAELRRLGLARAAEFSWQRAAQETLAVYVAAAQDI